MSLEHVIGFNLALLAAWLSPGPAMLVALRATVTAGIGAGLRTGMGLATMASLWTLAALFGLDAFFRLAPWAFGALKLAGAGYLIWVAIQTWRHASDALPDSGLARSRAFRQGVLVNLGNPKSILFAAAVLVVVFPPDLTTAERLFVGLNHLAFEIVAYGALAVFTVASRVDRLMLRAKPVFDRITAAVLGALGLRLLLDRETS